MNLQQHPVRTIALGVALGVGVIALASFILFKIAQSRADTREVLILQALQFDQFSKRSDFSEFSNTQLREMIARMAIIRAMSDAEVDQYFALPTVAERAQFIEKATRERAQAKSQQTAQVR